MLHPTISLNPCQLVIILGPLYILGRAHPAWSLRAWSLTLFFIFFFGPLPWPWRGQALHPPD